MGSTELVGRTTIDNRYLLTTTNHSESSSCHMTPSKPSTLVRQLRTAVRSLHVIPTMILRSRLSMVRDRPEMTYHYSSAPGPAEETVWRLCLLSPPFLLTGIGLLQRTAHDGFEAGTNRARLLGLPREMPLSLSTIPNCWQQTSQNLARHLAG
jgi:hypothetical protein